VSLPAGRIYLFDTSIWDYTDHPLIAADWDGALERGELAVSQVVAFEVFYEAQNQAEFEALDPDAADQSGVAGDQQIQDAVQEPDCLATVVAF